MTDKQFQVYLVWYSLNKEGFSRHLSQLCYSQHRSINAAYRMLGSLISGKRKGDTIRPAHPGAGVQMYVYDTHTRERWSRDGNPITWRPSL